VDGPQKKIETNRTKMKSLTPVSKEIYLLKLQVSTYQAIRELSDKDLKL